MTINIDSGKIDKECELNRSYGCCGCVNYYDESDTVCKWGCVEQMAGYKNKMFVRADLMPHRIRITDIKVERLQDISEADIMQEGIMKGEFMNTWDRYYYDHWGDVANHITFRNPQLAYQSLIDRICGKGTWDSNPWVWAYTFEVIK